MLAMRELIRTGAGWRREICQRHCASRTRGGSRGCRHGRARALPQVRHPPDAALLVVTYIECAIRPHGQARRAVIRATRCLFRSGEAVGEDHVVTRGLAVGHGLVHHVVATLRRRRAIPGTMEGDEGATAPGVRELLA